VTIDDLRIRAQKLDGAVLAAEGALDGARSGAADLAARRSDLLHRAEVDQAAKLDQGSADAKAAAALSRLEELRAARHAVGVHLQRLELQEQLAAAKDLVSSSTEAVRGAFADALAQAEKAAAAWRDALAREHQCAQDRRNVFSLESGMGLNPSRLSDFHPVRDYLAAHGMQAMATWESPGPPKGGPLA
jgi:hypothetical protein